MLSLRIEPATSDVKGDRSDHCILCMIIDPWKGVVLAKPSSIVPCMQIPPKLLFLLDIFKTYFKDELNETRFHANHTFYYTRTTTRPFKLIKIFKRFPTLCMPPQCQLLRRPFLPQDRSHQTTASSHNKLHGLCDFNHQISNFPVKNLCQIEKS